MNIYYLKKFRKEAKEYIFLDKWGGGYAVRFRNSGNVLSRYRTKEDAIRGLKRARFAQIAVLCYQQKLSKKIKINNKSLAKL